MGGRSRLRAGAMLTLLLPCASLVRLLRLLLNLPEAHLSPPPLHITSGLKAAAQELLGSLDAVKKGAAHGWDKGETQ